MHVAVVGVRGSIDDSIQTGFRMPRYGPVAVGSLLASAGHRVDIYDEGVRELDGSAVEALIRADVVAMSVLTYGANRAYALASETRRRNPSAVIVMGDVHATLMPEHALRYADFIIRAEGEHTLLALVKALEIGDAATLYGLAGLSFRGANGPIHNEPRARDRDIDIELEPDRVVGLAQSNLFSTVIEGRRNLHIAQATRGCPVACTFCLGSKILGGRYRRGNVERVIDDLRRIQRLANREAQWVLFVDNDLFIDRNFASGLLRAIIAERFTLQFFAFARYPSVANDPELLELARKANFVRLFIGFESVNPGTLAEFRKPQSGATATAAIRAIHAQGLHIHGSFIFGADADTTESMRETLDFAIGNRITTASFFSLTQFPNECHSGATGTNVIPQNRLVATNLDHFDLHRVTHLPLQVRPSQLQRQLIDAIRRFYSPVRIAAAFASGDRYRALMLASGLWMHRRLLAPMRAHVGWLEQQEKGLYDDRNRLRVDRLPAQHPPIRDDVRAPRSWNAARGPLGPISMSRRLVESTQ
ncbi:MAG: B12-binding domain-containing radical SAM protein [Deltaproteobacteria bacterium]|nr:B12-binding domain-containing radical SAM protein [Deltaproteobacteria bacterium]